MFKRIQSFKAMVCSVVRSGILVHKKKRRKGGKKKGREEGKEREERRKKGAQVSGQAG